MSSTYTGTVTYSPSITIPDDGDDLNAASVNTPLQTLADNDAYLQSRDAEFYAIVLDGATLIATSGTSGWGTGDYVVQSGTSQSEVGRSAILSFTFTGGASDAIVAEYRLAYQLGSGTVTAIPGSVVQQSYSGLGDAQAVTLQGAVTFAAVDDLTFYLQLRVASGTGTAYAGSPYGGWLWLREVNT